MLVNTDECLWTGYGVRDSGASVRQSAETPGPRHQTAERGVGAFCISGEGANSQTKGTATPIHWPWV